MNQVEIGRYIAEKRTAQGMTQEKLAQKLGIAPKNVMRWESGKRLPDADVITALCQTLQVSLSELLNGKDAPEEDMQLTHDEQMIALLRRMQRTVYEQHILYGVLLILLGIASNALSALVGGSRVKDFFSGVLMGMSVVEMLLGVVVIGTHVIRGKCEE